MSALSLNCDVNYVKETYIKLIKTSGRDGFKSIRGLNSFFVMFTFDICSDCNLLVKIYSLLNIHKSNLV